MAVVVIGPTSVGKTTFLQEGTRERYFSSKYTEVLFAHQLKTRPITDNAIIHYNMLTPLHLGRYQKRLLKFPLRINSQHWEKVNKDWNFIEEPIFSKILGSGMVERCVVLVAPIRELLERTQTRDTAETYSQKKYPVRFWSQAITHLQLHRIYEQLFEILDQQQIPYEVYFSSRQVNGFAPSDRVHVHANLKGKFTPRPDKAHVETVAHNPLCQYQAVRLPYNIITDTKGYQHLPAERESILKRLLPENLEGASVLDVGSAMGGLLFLAERLGAERLVGIELSENRYTASQMLAELLQSQAELLHCDFLDYDTTQRFDHVYVLNVIHHVIDFHSFIRKAAQASLKTLTLEFPTLADNKFTSANHLSRSELVMLNRLPVIAISKGADQTFVYSPEAIRHLVMNEIGGFKKYELRQSAIKGRVVMIFSREK